MNNVFVVPIALKIIRLGFKDISIRCQSSKQNLSSYYDTLNLKPGCTKKEIRNSFIKLSKLNHPDVCGPSSNDRFVRINEAYNVLIDENKKKLYDETLVYTKNSNPIYYHYRERQNSENWKDVYNNPKNHWLASNIAIAGVCLSILVVGSIIRYKGIKKSASMRSLLMDESDERLSFLEEQKLMKIDKTNDELVKLFEQNIAKEYGHIVKK
ncbi:DnaJ-like protein 60-like [Acyrthosiphon pisum]|uniref:ACYPI004441 protein n=1 Tax=Acyrthosiphon pisum TaxID=7029 RepID=C4WX92_ACYPI|nr:DnaJ-like protein 60-like [Acyrthosiphon pisum]BAH72512.1 ACYPI004441 [Acyrthosiphon pisum]|eukprot:NP_001155569.1 DnaJ-like protein 60-like [Acyrthosiphon pisum]